MTPNAIASVRASYAGIAPRIDQLVETFYSTLFSRAPDTRRLFPADMARQKDHLAAALAVLFRNIENLDALEESLMSLGAQHVGFGVIPEHYVVLCDVMIESLRTVASPAWSSQLEAAWREALGHVSATMLKGAAAAALGVAHRLAPESSRSAPTGQARPA